MSIETWLIGTGAIAFLMALAFEAWKDLTFIRLMLDHLAERRHRREMEDRELEADLARADTLKEVRPPTEAKSEVTTGPRTMTDRYKATGGTDANTHNNGRRGD